MKLPADPADLTNQGEFTTLASFRKKGFGVWLKLSPLFG
jgi:hypothetical protein